MLVLLGMTVLDNFISEIFWTKKRRVSWTDGIFFGKDYFGFISCIYASSQDALLDKRKVLAYIVMYILVSEPNRDTLTGHVHNNLHTFLTTSFTSYAMTSQPHWLLVTIKRRNGFSQQDERWSGITSIIPLLT